MREGENGGLARLLAGGSPRRLIELERGGGAELYRLMLAAIEAGDRQAQLGLAARASDQASLRRIMDLFQDYLTRRLRGQPVPAAESSRGDVPLVTWAMLWEKAALRGQEVEEYNLDRRQFVLDLLESSALAINGPGVPKSV